MLSLQPRVTPSAFLLVPPDLPLTSPHLSFDLSLVALGEGDVIVISHQACPRPCAVAAPFPRRDLPALPTPPTARGVFVFPAWLGSLLTAIPATPRPQPLSIDEVGAGGAGEEQGDCSFLPALLFPLAFPSLCVKDMDTESDVIDEVAIATTLGRHTFQLCYPGGSGRDCFS